MTPHWVANKRSAHGWHKWFSWRQADILTPCCYCGCKLDIPPDFEDNHPTSASREHTQPRSRGGRRTLWSCLACNRDKAALTVNEYRAAVMWRRRRPVLFAYELTIPTNLIGIVWVWWSRFSTYTLRAV